MAEQFETSNPYVEAFTDVSRKHGHVDSIIERAAEHGREAERRANVARFKAEADERQAAMLRTSRERVETRRKHARQIAAGAGVVAATVATGLLVDNAFERSPQERLQLQNAGDVSTATPPEELHADPAQAEVTIPAPETPQVQHEALPRNG